MGQCYFRNDPEPNPRDQAGGSDFGYCCSAPVSTKQLENEARQKAWNCFQPDDVRALSCWAGQGSSQQEVRPRPSLAFEQLHVLEQGTPNLYTLQPQLECLLPGDTTIKSPFQLWVPGTRSRLRQFMRSPNPSTESFPLSDWV